MVGFGTEKNIGEITSKYTKCNPLALGWNNASFSPLQTDELIPVENRLRVKFCVCSENQLLETDLHTIIMCVL